MQWTGISAGKGSKVAYDLLVHGKGRKTTDILKAVKESYDENVTDEFIRPIVWLVTRW
jgi:bisphosphoglycerate-independent phosphoglycerate mutase (AlkP superfamily)